MDDNADLEMDPAIAEAMGFSGFGMQPGKKRKFDAQDSFVDPDLKQKAISAKSHNKGKGANDTPLGIRLAQETTGAGNTNASRADSGDAAHEPLSHAEGSEQVLAGDSTSGVIHERNNLQALRHGVKNEKGDMVYYLPSFIEDPWKDLKPR